MQEQRQHLILHAWKNGTISTTEANRYYSGNNGKDALISMEAQGYFVRTAPGVFKLNEAMLSELPHELVEKIERYEGSKDRETQPEYTKQESKQVPVP
jgi:hypothetical protein